AMRQPILNPACITAKPPSTGKTSYVILPHDVTTLADLLAITQQICCSQLNAIFYQCGFR
ncbi:hypothetical protein, partial [Sphingorhabdus sp.]|uniref:hypothetical protein n=1 Tax=Sphingorhabdus sp. TaxID=1902408 RepID=UPI003BAEB477